MTFRLRHYQFLTLRDEDERYTSPRRAAPQPGI